MVKIVVCVLLLCTLFCWYPTKSQCSSLKLQGKEGSGLVETISRKTSMFPLCDSISLLKSDPREDYWKGQCILKMKEALTNATANVPYIKSLMDKTKDPVLHKLLDGCYEANKGAVMYLPEAIDYAAKGDFIEVNSLAGLCRTDISDCEAQFWPRRSPLYARNNLMYQLLCTAGGISAFFLELLPFPPTPSPAN